MWPPINIRRLWPRGIRGRMMLLTFFLMSFIFLVSHLFVYLTLNYRLRQVVDFELTEELSEYLQAVKSADAADAKDILKFSQKYFSSSSHEGFAQAKRLILVKIDGRFVFNKPAARKLRAVNSDSGPLTYLDADDAFRLQTAPVTFKGKKIGEVKIAETLSSINRLLRTTLVSLGTSMLITLLITLLLGFFISRRILSPIAEIADVADAINKEDLSRRIDYHGGSDEVYRLAKTFDDMVDRLEIAFNEQRQFISDASHELRTPITIIKGHLEVLKLTKDPSQDDYQEALSIVLDELNRMNRLVNTLLLLARSSVSGFLIYDNINLKEFLERIFAKAVKLAERDWRLGAVPKANFRGDHDKLTEVLLNLIQNAVEHTAGRADIIELSAKVGRKWVKIEVADTGVGIPREDLKNIFNRFYRVDKARTKGAGGTGLGLSIVQAIIQAHGGKVEVRSRFGHGSTFTVYLPFKTAAMNLPNRNSRVKEEKFGTL